MNKTEKLICLALSLVLGWYLFFGPGKSGKGGAAADSAAATGSAAEVSQSGEAAASAPAPVPAPEAPKPKTAIDAPEKIVVLENDQLKLELSTWGASVKSATLKQYAERRGEISAENPALKFDFSGSRLGAGETLEAFETDGDVVRSGNEVSASFKLGGKRRKITLCENYMIKMEDEGIGGELSLGVMAMGKGKNDLLSLDSWQAGPKGGEVVHHCEGDSPLKAYLVGGMGGCGGSRSAAGLERTVKVDYAGAQTWIALKNRFFVTALVSSTDANSGFTAEIARDMNSSDYRPESIGARVKFSGASGRRTSVFYVGPKLQSLLWSLGMKDVMEFGMWRWFCYPIVGLLNLFNDWIPNYGVAIILLTILVRLAFWPLTHKSTVGMKKMQELQPRLKEIQARFKDNPQRLQQEMWSLYRNEKVNPMSSCLPMLVQIPVFIALFNVLRSAVELRYAPFLWIGDLSEPEGLFSDILPFGGLNLLPIFMAATMALQSALTPTTGDKNQQKMMVVFMPIMMLFMFYSFPSALSLYWTLSQVLSIWQMWLIRRSTARKTANAVMPEVIDPPQTRQMRRHG
jgi:YidC/Oxa1 family membrane protein insertase